MGEKVKHDLKDKHKNKISIYTNSTLSLEVMEKKEPPHKRSLSLISSVFSANPLVKVNYS